VKFLGAIPSHDMMDSKHPITYIYTSNVQTITVPYKTINNIQYTTIYRIQKRYLYIQ